MYMYEYVTVLYWYSITFTEFTLLRVLITHKGALSTVTRQLGEYLYIRIENVENNLFVKSYVRMANFNKVIKLLKLNLQRICIVQIKIAHSVAKSFSVGFSIAPPNGNNANSLQIWTLKAL